MRFYFDENNNFPRCVICGRTGNISWCEDCEEFFCPKCADNWGARLAGATVKKAKHIYEKFV